MRLASFLPAFDRRRATSFALAVAAHLLIALLLLRLAPRAEPPPTEDTPLSTFNVPPAPADDPRPTRQPRTVAKAARAAASPAPPAAAPDVPVPPPVAKPPPTPLLAGGMELFDAADIGKMKGRADEGDGAAAGKGDSVAAYGPGEGSGGQRLYNAEWLREPTHAEIAGYLPQGAPPNSWAMIACRTIPNYQVDNCRSLGEGPAGSGLARQMRLAAWQFRVRPPRLGGEPMIGAWVRIRFDWNSAGNGRAAD